jgi:ABC-type Fe3+ transport system permease subunit
VLFLVVLMALVGIQLTVRRYLTEPRIGLAKSRRTPALKLALIATIILVALTLGLVILTLIGPGWLPNLGDQELLWGYAVDIAVMVVNVCLFSLLGYLFGVPRLYLYGWLFGGGNLASVVLEDKYELAFNLPLAIAAGIILAIGVVLLRQFVQRYPMRMDEA